MKVMNLLICRNRFFCSAVTTQRQIKSQSLKPPLALASVCMFFLGGALS